MLTLRETLIAMISHKPGITTDEIKYQLGASDDSPFTTVYVCEDDVPTVERIFGFRALDNSFAY